MLLELVLHKRIADNVTLHARGLEVEGASPQLRLYEDRDFQLADHETSGPMLWLTDAARFAVTWHTRHNYHIAHALYTTPDSALKQTALVETTVVGCYSIHKAFVPAAAVVEIEVGEC